MFLNGHWVTRTDKREASHAIDSREGQGNDTQEHPPIDSGGIQAETGVCDSEQRGKTQPEEKA